MHASVILKRSPHLASALRRTLPAEEVTLLERAYDYAQATGGEEEVSFSRPAGQSYNPRPARVCLILLHDLSVRDARILQAGLVACGAEPRGYPSPEVAALAVLALQPPDELRCSGAREAAAIALALRLDLARHFHLMNEEALRPFLGETAAFLELARELHPSIVPRFETVARRRVLRTVEGSSGAAGSDNSAGRE